MSCVACKSPIFQSIYDFGSIPLVNDFTKNQINAKKNIDWISYIVEDVI